jgi:hypothetical protein
LRNFTCGGQTVILVHGWIDLPGHGKSGMPKRFTMEVFARA